ncbi:MAG: S-adenosylmethionine:tRNA ribosyltransferase-isomerase, partial [Verrucomicrobiia bacterium]
ETSPQHWLCLTSPGKKTRAGASLLFQSSSPNNLALTAEVLRTLETGERVVRFHQPFNLDDFGQVPLPPYIEQQRQAQSIIFQEDKERYQTVYAQHVGSVAAPTAGFHITPELLEKIPHAFVTLHVGLGTFRPVKTEKIQDHDMHREKFQVTPEVAQAITRAKRRVAVGTTSCRVLETLAQHTSLQGNTNIFIYPPYTFKNTDALLTNFHLPRSTLLMLVSGFLENKKPASSRYLRGIDFLKKIYEDAIQHNYRFYSYGDAMLIL